MLRGCRREPRPVGVAACSINKTRREASSDSRGSQRGTGGAGADDNNVNWQRRDLRTSDCADMFRSRLAQEPELYELFLLGVNVVSASRRADEAPAKKTKDCERPARTESGGRSRSNPGSWRARRLRSNAAPAQRSANDHARPISNVGARPLHRYENGPNILINAAKRPMPAP